MSRTARIQPHLEPLVLERATQGWTLARIVEWLETEHGVEASRMAVARFLRKARRERGETAGAVVREKLAETLASDVDRLARRQDQLGALIDDTLLEARGQKDVRDRALTLTLAYKAIDLERKITETKLRFSGAEDVDEKPKAEREYSATRALEELRKLAAKVAPEPEPQVH